MVSYEMRWLDLTFCSNLVHSFGVDYDIFNNAYMYKAMHVTSYLLTKAS